jgi:peptide chain release factor subunit 1
MAADLDLRTLAGITAPERAFLSVYLAGPHSVPALDRRFQKVRLVLKGGGGAEKDEREHFDENVKAVKEYLGRHPLKSGSLCIFSCWVLDFFDAVPLTTPVKDLVWIDSSPYIRPLAEFQDEYENVAVVVADNKKARIFLVSSAVAGSEEVVKGNVKNHVRKGGWSQQRYERRRDKQLLLYAREIVDALAGLDREEEFRRILLVGGKEILRIVHENLPHGLQSKVAEKALDLRKGESAVNEDIMELFFEQERQSERDLWEKIRAEYLRGGLGVVGLDEVLSAAKEGRVEKMIVNRTFKPEGRRCRDCETLDVGPVERCSACGSESLFVVDVVNEIVEMLKLTGAEADFADPIETLVEAGKIAALLRY